MYLGDTNVKINTLAGDIETADFTNADLSMTLFMDIKSINNCKFDNTRMHFTNYQPVKLSNSSFENCDFSSRLVDISIFVKEVNPFSDHYYIFNCNLKNTGLKIEEGFGINSKEPFNELLQKGYLDGCVLKVF